MNAIRGDHVAETVVIVAEEFGKVVQQDQKDAQRSFVQHRNGFAQLGIAEERGQKLEQVNQQLGVHSPSLLLRRNGQQATDKYSVRNDFQPSVRKARSFGGSQNVQSMTERRQYL